MRLGDLRQWQHLGDLQRIAARADALREAIQPVPSRHDRRHPRLDTALEGRGEVGEAGQGDDAAAVGELVQARQEGRVVVGVQHDVDAAPVGEALDLLAPVARVVGDRGRAQLADPLCVRGAAGGEHLGGPGLERHRDQQLAHAAGAAVDQHRLVLGDPGGVLHGGDRGEADECEPGPAGQVLLGGLAGDRGEVVGRDRDDLGGDAAGVARAAHAEHARADGEAARAELRLVQAGARADHGASHLTAGPRGQREVLRPARGAVADLVVQRVQPHEADLDEDLLGTRLGHRGVVVEGQDLGAPEAVESDLAHALHDAPAALPVAMSVDGSAEKRSGSGRKSPASRRRSRLPRPWMGDHGTSPAATSPAATCASTRR